MANQRVLIVDDEPDIRELLELTLMRMGLDTLSVPDLKSAIRQIDQHAYDLCLTDMRLPDGNGLELVKYIQHKRPDTPVAMITAHGNMELAIDSLKAGAFDFVSKPVEIERLRALVNQALKISNTPSSQASPAQAIPTMVGESEAMTHLQSKIRKLARSQAPVFIQGESGTGKELVARQIHALGPRAEGPFVPVNCGAIPSELMESEFFGHKKGAFTGASEDKAGFFQAANNGTLFLDEVADLPLAMQVKLLRSIQEKKIRSIGSQQETDVDVRILSATHKNLDALVASGEFRQDLFYRINVINLPVPALRERISDIPLLCQRILIRIAESYELAPARLDKAAENALMNYPFPGNVRELENILERAYTLCEDDRIGLRDLQLDQTPAAAISGANGNGNGERYARPSDMNLEDYLMEVEREVVEQALEETRWNRTAAAKRLGITFRALRYRLKKLGLD
ncbi:sigma-54-dependent transcriptional regulator [Saccharospirillum alexandrii]|uniref:sigma-54-dependent transcriptional regulator n=1 Tax=Saccharospirillum alexandrii TaxID=2448477 RepID=UPI0037354C8B